MSNAFKLRNGTILLSTEAPGGIYNAAQLKKIASLCEGETAIVKATEDQRLALFVKPEQANTIAGELKAIGLGIRHYQDGLHHPTSCIGELCPDHEQDALGSALDISQQLDAIKLASPLKIGINGCARCCVPCHTLDISVVGDAAGYRINLGGKNSQLPEMASFMAEGIPASELPNLILKVIELYKNHAQEGESLQEVIERAGSVDFIQILAPYSQDAAGADPFANNDPSPEEALELEAAAAPEEISEDLSTTIDENDIIEHDELGGIETADIQMEAASADEDHSFTLTADDGDHLDLSAADLQTLAPMDDIDPQTIAGMDELGSEVQISQPTQSGPDINLTDDFGEDSLDAAPEAVESAHLTEIEEAHMDSLDISTPLDLESIPEDDLPLTDLEDDLTESAIDVSDVLKGTIQHLPTTVEEAPLEDLPFEELDPIEDVTPVLEAVTDQEAIADVQETPATESEEDAYEQQLTASIAAQEQLVDQSGSDEEREQTLELLDDNQTTLDEQEAEVAQLSEQEPELSEQEPELIAAEDEVSDGELSDDDDLNLDDADHLPLSEMVAIKKSPIAVAPTPMRRSKNESVKSLQQAGWTFVGLDMDTAGNPMIKFSNGVQLTLTNDAITNGSIMIGGHTITLNAVAGGVEMHLDGMKMFLPKAA